MTISEFNKAMNGIDDRFLSAWEERQKKNGLHRINQKKTTTEKQGVTKTCDKIEIADN